MTIDLKAKKEMMILNFDDDFYFFLTILN